MVGLVFEIEGAMLEKDYVWTDFSRGQSVESRVVVEERVAK